MKYNSKLFHTKYWLEQMEVHVPGYIDLCWSQAPARPYLH